MRWRRWICIALAPFFFLLSGHDTPQRKECYRGWTAAQWEREIRHWKPWAGGFSSPGGRFTFWGPKQPLWNVWLENVGIKVDWDRGDVPLLGGDPSAVPVLTELLTSRDPQARRIAAEGLEKIREKARLAVPALLRAIDDQDDEVRGQAEEALFCIDREAAERAGLEWNDLGVFRRNSNPSSPKKIPPLRVTGGIE